MANNHKQGQRIRRLTERLTGTEAVQDVIIDVVADHSRKINDLDRRMAAMENEKENR